MNEKLFKLAVAAGFSEWSHRTVGRELERFAELIVRECANIDFWATGHVTDRGADVIGCKILDHFGVE